MKHKSISVLSWNIHSCIGTDGICAPERIRAAIEQFDCDVVCLQEVGWHLRGTKHIDQFKIIERSGPYFAFHTLTKTRNAHFGNLILSKFPIVESTSIRLGRWWGIPRAMQSIQVNVDGIILRLMNTHLGLDPFERISQLSIIRKFVEQLPHGHSAVPTILCGDFNALRTGREIRRLAALFDIAHAFRTFPSKRPLLKLDRIFATNILSVDEISVVNTNDTRHLSDHLPVKARISIGTIR